MINFNNKQDEVKINYYSNVNGKTDSFNYSGSIKGLIKQLAEELSKETEELEENTMDFDNEWKAVQFEEYKDAIEETIKYVETIHPECMNDAKILPYVEKLGKVCAQVKRDFNSYETCCNVEYTKSQLKKMFEKDSMLFL